MDSDAPVIATVDELPEEVSVLLSPQPASSRARQMIIAVFLIDSILLIDCFRFCAKALQITVFHKLFFLLLLHIIIELFFGFPDFI